MKTYVCCRGGSDIDDDEDAGCCPGKISCGGGSGSGSGSQSPGSGRGRGHGGGGKRKAAQKSGGAPKKAKGVIYEGVSDLKHTAAGGANPPPTQRYDFYRYFGTLLGILMMQSEYTGICSFKCLFVTWDWLLFKKC
jgi:hypothetical protein